MAQWIKASDYGSEGWGFESLWALHEKLININAICGLYPSGFFISIYLCCYHIATLN